MTYVKVNDQKFDLVDFSCDGSIAQFVIPVSYSYSLVKENFLHNNGTLLIEPGHTVLEDFSDLRSIIDDMTVYNVTVYKVFNDEEAIKTLAGYRASAGEAKELRKALESAAANIPDEDAANDVWMFPKWKTNVYYAVGDRVQYNLDLYKCIQAHTSQADWTPDVAVSLFVKVADPSEEWPEWVQPTGAHDAYAKGDKVSHNGSHWTSSIDANVWEPGVYGWTVAE